MPRSYLRYKKGLEGSQGQHFRKSSIIDISQGAHCVWEYWHLQCAKSDHNMRQALKTLENLTQFMSPKKECEKIATCYLIRK